MHSSGKWDNPRFNSNSICTKTLFKNFLPHLVAFFLYHSLWIYFKNLPCSFSYKLFIHSNTCEIQLFLSHHISSIFIKLKSWSTWQYHSKNPPNCYCYLKNLLVKDFTSRILLLPYMLKERPCKKKIKLKIFLINNGGSIQMAIIRFTTHYSLWIKRMRYKESRMGKAFSFSGIWFYYLIWCVSFL